MDKGHSGNMGESRGRNPTGDETERQACWPWSLEPAGDMGGLGQGQRRPRCLWAKPADHVYPPSLCSVHRSGKARRHTCAWTPSMDARSRANSWEHVGAHWWGRLVAASMHMLQGSVPSSHEGAGPCAHGKILKQRDSVRWARQKHKIRLMSQADTLEDGSTSPCMSTFPPTDVGLEGRMSVSQGRGCEGGLSF